MPNPSKIPLNHNSLQQYRTPTQSTESASTRTETQRKVHKISTRYYHDSHQNEIRFSFIFLLVMNEGQIQKHSSFTTANGDSLSQRAFSATHRIRTRSICDALVSVSSCLRSALHFPRHYFDTACPNRRDLLRAEPCGCVRERVCTFAESM